MAGSRSGWKALVAAALSVVAVTAVASAQNQPTAPVVATPAVVAPAATAVPPVPAVAAPAAAAGLAPALPSPDVTPVAAPAKIATPVAEAAAPEPDGPPPPPLKRPRFASAILQATDKITAETLRFEAKVGESVRYKGLIVTLRACETTAADDDTTDSMANLEILSQPQGVTGAAALPAHSVFKGWTFASSPSLHPLEHPLYDLWLISCRTSAPVGVAPKA